MPDRQNTGAVRGSGTADQQGASDDDDAESLGADGAQRDDWRKAGTEETEDQRLEREAAAEEHQERFAKGPVRGKI